MKYFRVVNPDDVTEEFYVSCNKNYEGDRVKEYLGLQAYWLEECTKEEFETMTQDVNDYILNVGQTRDNLKPYTSAHDLEEAETKALELRKTWKCVEIVYMPCADVDVNQIIWAEYER